MGRRFDIVPPINTNATIAETRVPRTEKYSAIALVTASKREVVSGDLAVKRPGQ